MRHPMRVTRTIRAGIGRLAGSKGVWKGILHVLLTDKESQMHG